MNLKQLEVFLAVADSGSFSRAAETSFITQSTVSQHVSALEGAFGVRLFDRTGKGALLTEGGKVLSRHARQVIADIQTLEQAMQRFKGIEDVELRIGGSSTPANHLIPDFLPIVIERFPRLRITLIQGDSREILAKLAAEEIELGIVGSSFNEEGFHFVPLGRDEICLVVNRHHPWHGRKSASLNELYAIPLVLREAGSGTGKTLVDALTRSGVSLDKLKIVACLGSNESVKNAVVGGLGSSFVSVMSVRKELEREELAIVRIDGLDIIRHFYLASRSGRELSPAARVFAEIAENETLRSEPKAPL
jgi:LysR family transcriptional regulator, low CO2-responsive transcriptional regulator